MGWNRRRSNDNYRVAQRYEEYDASGRLVLRPGPRRGGLAGAPIGSYAILAICLAAFAVFNLGMGRVPEQLMANPLSGSLFPGLFTSMFMHADTGHLIANMLALYFFGPVVERDYGTPRFLILFLVAGLLASLAQCAVVPGPGLGASGALSGVLAAFTRHYPQARVYLFFILPMPMWVASVLWMVFNLAGAFHLFNLNLGFTAHLAGFAVGWLLSYILFPPGKSLVSE